MRPKHAKFWLYALGTRPMWGMLPLRIMFGVILVLEGLSRFVFFHENKAALLASLPSAWGYAILIGFSVIEILSGCLAIPGFLARFAGLCIVLEMTLSIAVERIPLAFGRGLETQMLLLAIAGMMLFSGAGRHSVDHRLALRMLKNHPNRKKELYCVAEMPLCRWWE